MRYPPSFFFLPFVLLVGTIPVFCQQPDTADLLTLDQAVSLALQHNRLVQSSALEVRKFDDKRAATHSLRLPALNWYTLGSQRLTALDFSFPKGAFGIFPGIGPVPATDTSIHTSMRPAALLIGRVDQPLSQQYRISLNMHALDLGRQVASQQERAQKQAVVDQVKRTYYAILQMQSALESMEESIKLYQELDRVTEQYVLQQTALKAQSLEIKTRLAKAEYDALTIRDPIQTQKEQLNSVLGRDLKTEFRVSPVPDADDSKLDLAEAQKSAVEQRPELKQARLKVQEAEYDRRIKKAEYIPNVSLSFSYLSPVNYGSLIPANIASAGLLLDWEPFDWGRKKSELEEKSRTIEQAELALQESESQITIEVASKYRKLQETRQLIVVCRLAQETARENLRVVGNRYKEEASLLKDVLQAQASLAEANNQFQQALQSYWTARADFEKALGGDN
jgi:outer membrane protein TolC